MRDSYFDQGHKTLHQPPDDLNRAQQTEADAMLACALQEQEKAKLLERSRKLEQDREKQERVRLYEERCKWEKEEKERLAQEGEEQEAHETI